ncbi:MAG: response regulator [Leptospiraceae bacterium]|nr:response regulator [Leptospiraceae bacterium]
MLKFIKKAGLTFYSQIILWIALNAFFYFLMIKNFNDEVSLHKKARLHTIELQFKSIITHFRQHTELLYSTLIEKPPQIDVLARGLLTTDPVIQGRYRRQLQDLLSQPYEQLTLMGLKQLHFHTVQNRSYLRMHRPALYGDDLSGVRHTVVAANRQHRPQFGFEEGRIFNALRFVYPVRYQGRHIGSVEISISARGVMRTMNSLYHGNYRAIFAKDLILQKVFKEEQSNYKPSAISPDFYIEQNRFDQRVQSGYLLSVELTNRIEMALRQLSDARFHQFKPFVIFLKVDDSYYSCTAWPLFSFQDRPIGYILNYEQADDYAQQRQYLIASVLILTVFLFLMTGGLIKLEIDRQNQAAQQLQLIDALSVRDRFLANMSHEIRTPINGVLGLCELLQETQLSETQRDYLYHLQTAGESLQAIIADVLEFSRMRQRGVGLNPVVCRVRDIVVESVDFFQARSMAGPVQYEIDVAESVDEKVFLDPGRLRQVLFNLLGNADKFTTEGCIKVCLRRPDELWPEVQALDCNVKWYTSSPSLVDPHNPAHWLELAVIDTGIGIPPDKLGHIFSEFEQADQSLEISRRGTGLGLSITRAIVAAFCGHIRVESQPGQGSRFCLQFLAPPCTTATDPARQPEEGPREHSGRILVAEDNPLNQMLVRTFLEKAGYTVQVCANGRELVQAWQEAEFICILMDVQMPVMDGYEATREIRRLEQSKAGPPQSPIPIIALSAGVLDDEKRACFEAGMNSFVPKPVKRQELLEVIASQIRWRNTF